MLLGVVIHALVSFYPNIAPYYFVQDVATHRAMPVLGWLIHGFRMQLFFVMTGFFAHLGLKRRPLHNYLRTRCKRIVAPLLVLAPLVVLFDVAMRRWSASRGTLSPDYAGFVDVMVRPLYLWFLYYLTMFTVAAAFVRKSTPLWVPIVVTAIVSYWVPEPAPAFSYIPDPISILYFGGFFAFGYTLFERRDLLELFRKYAAIASVIAVGAAFFEIHVVYAWSMVVALIGWFMYVQPSPWIRFGADGAYWVYIVHYPQVVALQILTSRWPGGVAVKLTAIILLVSLTSFASYALFVRNRPLGRIF